MLYLMHVMTVVIVGSVAKKVFDLSETGVIVVGVVIAFLLYATALGMRGNGK